jgi:predicted lipoprotein with Yx(FWY)xxD motif
MVKVVKARWEVRAVVVCAVAIVALAMATAPGHAATKTPPTVTVVKVDGLGKVLADPNGMTLYTLTSNGAAVPCTDSCAAVWPPLIASGTPKAPKGVKRIAVTSTGQVTQGGLPLYLFAGDKAKGQTTGNGLNSFGGVWQVVKIKSSSTAKQSDTSSGGYGY